MFDLGVESFNVWHPNLNLRLTTLFFKCGCYFTYKPDGEEHLDTLCEVCEMHYLAFTQHGGC